MKVFEKPLFIFEMANNHMGDVEHGIRIIQELKKIVSGINEFNFAVKLQKRDNTFIHPDHVNRTDHRLIKRFVETRITNEDFKRLTDEIKSNGFVSICTPFDEVSVDWMVEMDYDIIKIASCSFNDWPLLEKVVKSKKPIIASTAGASADSIDQVVSFFSHRQKEFAIMHCVGEYPCPIDHIELNQIDYFKERYPGVPIGYSTHEDPSNMSSIQIAVAKGANLFEKHVGFATEKYALNAYSATPEQIKMWVNSAVDAFKMCGGAKNKRKGFSEKELSDLRTLQRGVYADKEIQKGAKLELKDFYLGMPNEDGQIIANDLSKYNDLYAEKDFKKGEQIMFADVKIRQTRKKVLEVIDELRKMLVESKVVLPPYVDLEISYHYGIEKFDEIGCILIKVVVKEYCKILIVMFPGQLYPRHHHNIKDESYHILYGDLTLEVEGTEHKLERGGLYSVTKGQLHSFWTTKGVIIEELSTANLKGDTLYEDDFITNNPHRKTLLTFWPDWESNKSELM